MKRHLSFPNRVEARRNNVRQQALSHVTLEDSQSGMIVTMQGHFGVPHSFAALGLSMLVFKPKWMAVIKAGPLSMLFAVLFVIGAFACVFASGR